MVPIESWPKLQLVSFILYLLFRRSSWLPQFITHDNRPTQRSGSHSLLSRTLVSNSFSLVSTCSLQPLPSRLQLPSPSIRTCSLPGFDQGEVCLRPASNRLRIGMRGQLPEWLLRHNGGGPCALQGSGRQRLGGRQREGPVGLPTVPVPVLPLIKVVW